MNRTAAIRVASRYLEAGLIKPPPAMVDSISRWVSACIALTVLKGTSVMDKDAWERIAERGQEFNPQPLEGYTVEQKFEVDLTGWPYDAEQFRRVVAEKPYWRKISVSINSLSPTSNWRAAFGRVTLNIRRPTSDYIRNGMLDAWRDTVYHELQHMTQSLMSVALFDKNVDRVSPQRTQPGLPNPSERTPEFLGAGALRRDALGNPVSTEKLKPNTLHHLDDIEFHTDLQESISRFLRAVQKSKLTADHRQAFFNAYTHRPGSKWDGEPMPLPSSDFFADLKKHAPKKYIKAMREFAAAVL